jgi:hypothetical protein
MIIYNIYSLKINLMKKFLLGLLPVLMFTGITFGQLSGDKYIGTTTPTPDYASIALAIADLNTLGVTGSGVTFNVAAGYTETITAPISVTATGVSGVQIIFQKYGSGANPLITAYGGGTGTPGTAVQDGIWNFVGSDYVTIDGINLYDPNIANPATMEYGYAMFKASVTNGCQYNTIKNCVVTLNRVNNASGTSPAVDGSRAINLMNALVSAQTTVVVPTLASGTNSYNKLYSNTLQNCNIGIAIIGYAGTTPFTLCDFGNDIGGSSLATGNNILNYGGAPVATNPAAGVRTLAQYNLNVSYNTVNNNNGSGISHVSTLRGIYLNTAVSANATISYNNLSINGGSTTSQISVIENISGSTAASNTININNNTIHDCSWPTATSGIFYGILNSSTAFTVNIFGNIISNMITPNTGNWYAIAGQSPVNLNIYNNEIGNITKTVSGTLYAIQGATATVSVHDNNVHHLTMSAGGNAVYGYYNLGSPTNETYYNNTFNNFTCNGTGGVFGIYTNTVAGTRNVYSNSIYNFSAVGGGPVYGIYGAASSPNIYKNNIYNLSSGAAGGIVYGIYHSSGTTANIYNNFISDLRTPAANAAFPLVGIYVSGGTTINVFYNSIYLNGASTGVLFGSAALYASTTPTLDMRNNVLVNVSTPNGTGVTAAYRRSSTTLGTYSANSNANAFYAGPNEDATHAVYYDGATPYAIAAYKTLVSPRDAASFRELPPFNNIAPNPAPYNLHLNSTSTLCESGGANVSGITEDFDGQTRQGNPGYAGTGLAPDIGADEFEGTNPNWVALDMGATALVAPITTGCYTSTETVTITIKNYGTATIDFSVNPVTVTINVTGAVTQALSAIVNSGTLVSGASTNVNMTSTLDMTAVGTYTFNASTSVIGDGNAANDAISPATRTVIASTATPYSQNFDASTSPPSGWTTTGWTIGTTHANPATGNGLYKNLWSSAPSGQFTLLKLGPISSTDALNFDYRIVNYTSYPATPTPNSPAWGSLTIQISTDCGGTFSTLAIIDPTNHISSLSWATMTYPLSVYTGQSAIIRFNALWLAGDYYIDFDNFSIQSPPTCFPPTALATSNYTVNGADLFWTSPDSFFDIFIQSTGLPAPGPGTTPTVNDYNTGSPSNWTYTWAGGTLGQTYDWYVRTDCAAGGGTGQSTWSGPNTFSLTNDVCNLSYTVTCGNIVTGTTTGATPDAPGACNVPNYTYPGVWYHFVGIGDMVSVDLCTSTSWDSQISVYQGTCGSLTCVDGNDDYCALQSRVDWYATLSVDYFILIHQYGTTGGAFTLTVNCTYPTTAIWQGDDTSPSAVDWFGADNWDVADVPGSTTTVVIPTGLTNYPTVDRKGICNNISIASGARLVDQGSGYLIPNGTATVNQDYTGGEWHLISSPVSGATANMFVGLYLQNHTESTNAYTDISNPATPLNVMQGYALWNDLAGTASFVGALNTGAMGAANNVTRSGLGWNLVGNPYASPIDWDAAAGWTKTNVNNATYIHRTSDPNPPYFGWAAYVGGVGTNGGSRYIAPCQGFFVGVTSGFTFGTLSMTNDVRTHSTATFYKDEVADIVRLEVSGNGYADETVIRFLDVATQSFDGDWDASKLFEEIPEAAAIYSTDNGMMAINSLPATNTVPLGVKAGIPGEFTITATETSEFADVILEDLLMGTFTDLKSNSYTFSYDMNFDNRFIVHFTPLAVGENPADLINIYSSQKDVYVSVPANTKGDIVVYNLMGQEVARSMIKDVLNKITLDNSGYYLVKVMSNESVVTKKVFVK